MSDSSGTGTGADHRYAGGDAKGPSDGHGHGGKYQQYSDHLPPGYSPNSTFQTAGNEQIQGY